jgi:hypothetical protein
MLSAALVDNEADLLPQHDHDPVYVPALKAVLTMGHFIIFNVSNSVGTTERRVGQLLRHCCSAMDKVQICLYLPLYEEETLQYIGFPTVLPRAVQDMSCTGTVEVVNVSGVANIPVTDIVRVAFIFLGSDVVNNTYYVQGVEDAYITRFKYSVHLKELIELPVFFSFPDLFPESNAKWCECYSRSIFSGIVQLRQELWQFLCRYGQSQGHNPKALIKLPISQSFSFYIVNFLVPLGLQTQLYTIKDQERRIHSSFLFRTIRVCSTYCYFNLDTEDKLGLLSKLIGVFSLVGIQACKPKLDAEHDLKVHDALNVVTKVELLVSSTNIWMKVLAVKHIVGDTAQMEWLRRELHLCPAAQPRPVLTQAIRINSRFDYNGSLFKVASVDENNQV